MAMSAVRKHKRKIITGVLFLLLASSFVFYDELVRLYVRLNSSLLEDFALASLEDCEEEFLLTRYGLWDVTVWKQAGVVEFHTRQSTAFGGIEKGFCYSKADTPISFQATNYPLATDGAGWTWADLYGNHGYTERIRPRWFWYEAVL